jgi:hypothetical protein
MKKLAISALTMAVTCCGASEMEKYQTTELFPKEFWSDTEMVSKCMAEVKEKVEKEITERELEGDPLDYCKLFRRHTWNWICEHFQYEEEENRGKFLNSIIKQFSGRQLPFLTVIEKLGLEEKYWTREWAGPARKRYFFRSVDDD